MSPFLIAKSQIMQRIHKACASVGRNPEASTKIMVQSILAMALAEAIIFIAIFLGG